MAVLIANDAIGTRHGRHPPAHRRGPGPPTRNPLPHDRRHPGEPLNPVSRFGQLPGDSVEYTPTEPPLVVEVDTDRGFHHYRWRHSTAL